MTDSITIQLPRTESPVAVYAERDLMQSVKWPSELLGGLEKWT